LQRPRQAAGEQRTGEPRAGETDEEGETDSRERVAHGTAGHLRRLPEDNATTVVGGTALDKNAVTRGVVPDRGDIPPRDHGVSVSVVDNTIAPDRHESSARCHAYEGDLVDAESTRECRPLLTDSRLVGETGGDVCLPAQRRARLIVSRRFHQVN
jgi:hypothetical protein